MDGGRGEAGRDGGAGLLGGGGKRNMHVYVVYVVYMHARTYMYVCMYVCDSTSRLTNKSTHCLSI